MRRKSKYLRALIAILFTISVFSTAQSIYITEGVTEIVLVKINEIDDRSIIDFPEDNIQIQSTEQSSDRSAINTSHICKDNSENNLKSEFPGYDSFIHSMINETSGSNIYDYIDILQSFENEDGVPTRVTGSLGFDESALWVYNELKSYGLEVFMQNFTFYGGSSTNVVGVHPGTDPDLEPQTFIIGGHLDSINSYGSSYPAPGADDNGSGTVVTLEAARIMSQYQFKRTIRFATWGAEEQGLHGSAYYVSNIVPDEEKVMGYLNYDMLGYADDDLAVSLHANTASNWMLDYMVDVSDVYDNIGVNFTYIYDSTETRSDHANFWDDGYNATLAIETVFSPYYHSAEDTLDKITIPQITHTTRHAIAMLAHLAEPGMEPGEPPSVTVTSPDGGETFTVGTYEEITWNTVQGDDPVDYIDLWYSVDNGSYWNTIEAGLPDAGSYTWTVPNEHSAECLVRARAVDTMNRWGEDISDDVFEIIGSPPAPPQNLTVEYHGQSVQVLFEDYVEDGDLGYITGESHIQASDWGIRSHGASSGVNSWDFGDGMFNKDGSEGMLSWLISPGISIPVESDPDYGVSFTFQHWRDWGDTSLYDAGNVKISTDGDGGPWTLIVPEEGYDGTVPTSWDNPLGGQEAWGGTSDWTTATFDLTNYIGETVHIRWDAGVEAWDGLEGPGWRVDDIYVDALITDEEGTDHNLLTWEASSDDPDEVGHYSIFRSEFQSGPWNESALIANVNADGFTQYEYVDVDKGEADDILWWYVVRAVGENGLEEQNTDSVQEHGGTVIFDIELYAGGDAGGWNFVSFNLVQSDSSLETILEDPELGISGSYEKVMYFDTSTDSWYTYVPGRGEQFNNLENWNHRMGVWIRMTVDDVLTIAGTLPGQTSITLQPGWNMVGLPSSTSGNHGLPGEIDRVGYFDSSQTHNLAYDYSPGAFVFEPGQGYWIHNPTDTELVWTVDY